jgi:hypothetical protein
VKRFLSLVLVAPLLVAASKGDEEAVRAVLASISAGEVLPEAILNRQIDSTEFPDLDQSLARAKGCTVAVLEPLTYKKSALFGVQWRCKGRKRKEMPSALMVYAVGGQVTQITTAFVESR